MMARDKRLMELRKNMNKKRPSFRRVESWRYKRVKDSWRKARGIDSKTRKKKDQCYIDIKIIENNL